MVRDAFLSKAARTSRSHRRWFRLDEIESDAEKRQELLGLWRASIYSRDLDLKGRSQVLCLTASPLLGGYRSPRARSDLFRDDKTISARTKAVLAAAKRLPAELARAEHFNASVGDLWMSAPRWRESLTGKDTKPP